ncbi:MAG: sulfotransferase [Caldilineaceae bacterium]|nr:sulfotransferase [Caldilineaceae bacterium]
MKADSGDVDRQDEKGAGENLIFLISLPRSGSTLLQHMLASHSNIAAVAEPWILFPAAYALRTEGIQTNYNHKIAQIALTEFLAQLEGEQENYYQAVRKLALHLYGGYLSQSKKERFLDKTSRYYLILPELVQIFPNAKIIFLVRNPLALLSSYIESMVFGNWRRFGEPGIRDDLLDGYRLIRQGIWYFGDSAIVVKYEDLVRDPGKVMRRLCDQLEINYEDRMLDYGSSIGVLPGRLVDPKSIHRHHSPVSSYANAWQSKLQSPQEKAFARGFLDHLGQEMVENFGYDFKSLRALVSTDTETRQSAPVIPWQVLMTEASRRSMSQQWQIDYAVTWQTEGKRAAQWLRLRHTGKKLYRVAQPLAKRIRKFSAARSAHIYNIPKKYTEMVSVSDNYALLDGQTNSVDSLRNGWQSSSVAERQITAYEPLLEAMHAGQPRQDFRTAAQALALTRLPTPSLLEIGCGNGYYSEIFSTLTSISPRYSGVDYSQAMVRSAIQRYSQCPFIAGDAARLPFSSDCFDIAWIGTSLMHMPEYALAIREASRVAKRFCVFHSTPLVANPSTIQLSKTAYGAHVYEVIIAKSEFDSLIHENGLVVRHILESLPYSPKLPAGLTNVTILTLTYICEKLPAP